MMKIRRLTMEAQQTIARIDFGKCSVFSMTPQQVAEHDAEIVLYEQRQEERERDSAFRLCGIGPEYFGCRFDNFRCNCKKQEEMLGYARRLYASIVSGDNRSLVMYGSCGTGKTHLAAALLYEVTHTSRMLEDYGIKTWYSGTYEMSDAIRSRLHATDAFGAKETREDVIRMYGSVSFLVIDEIGRSPSSDENNALYAVINARYENRKPTLLISNYTYTEFCSALGSAAMSRLASCAAYVDTTGIPDQRYGGGK